MDDAQQGVGTRLSHFGEDQKIEGAVVPPIFQTSLFVYDRLSDLHTAMAETPAGPPFHYSRVGNPSVDLVERKIANLEGTDAAKLFTSGMTAITAAIQSAVQSGSHVVAPDTAYGPVRLFLSTYLKKFGVTVTFVDGRCVEDYLDAVRPETSLIYLEAPSSLVFRMQDVPKIAQFARGRKITTIIDNTYNTPLHFNPAAHGVDMVCHSVTKYLGGHSDLIAGAVCTNAERMDRMIRAEVFMYGSVLPPFPSWLVLRGLRTLKVRVKHHEACANAVAGWLETRPEIDVVHHLGLDSYPQKGLSSNLLRGTGGLFAFEPITQDHLKIQTFVDSLKLFGRGISWGGFESLVVNQHVQPAGYREKKALIRLYCGLEEPEDLIADISQAIPALR